MIRKLCLYLVIYLEMEAYVDVDEQFTDFVLFVCFSRLQCTQNSRFPYKPI